MLGPTVPGFEKLISSRQRQEKDQLKCSKSYYEEMNRCLGSPAEAARILKGLGFWLISGLNICSPTLSQYGNLYSSDKCLRNVHGDPGSALATL